MYKINLVPEVQARKQQIKKINRWATISAISLTTIILVITAVIAGIDISKKAELKNVKSSISETEKESSQYAELEKTVLSLEAGLNGVKEILNGSNHWSLLLPHLEKATPADVKFTQLSLMSGDISGSVTAASVESMAKFIDSYKQYRVIAVSGPGIANETVSISIDGGGDESVFVNNEGRWVYAINVDPEKDHEIRIATADKQEIIIKYTAATKNIASTDPSVTAEAKNLFSNIQADQYTKTEDGIKFDIKISFDQKALW